MKNKLQENMRRFGTKNLNEQQLEKVKSSMSPGSGLINQGYTGEDGWKEKLATVVNHTYMYKFNGDKLNAIQAAKKEHPAKESFDVVTFTMGNENVTYIGID